MKHLFTILFAMLAFQAFSQTTPYVVKSDTIPSYFLVSFPPTKVEEASPTYTVLGYTVIQGSNVSYLAFDKTPFSKELVIWANQVKNGK